MEDTSDFSILPREVVSEDIFSTASMSPPELYAVRMISPRMYQRYRRTLRDWILDPESWMTAIINDDMFLYRDLQFLMTKGDVFLEEDVDYDSDNGEWMRYPHYLRSYDDLRFIDLSIRDIIDAMYDNYSFSTFSEAMTNRHFKRELLSLYSADKSVMEKIVQLAQPHRETLMSLIDMFRNNYQGMESIISLMMEIFGNEGAEEVIELMIETEIKVPDWVIQTINDNVNGGMYPYVDPVYVSYLLNEYAQSL